MTKEQLSEILNGREVRYGVPTEIEQMARENNLVVLYCISDDLLEVEGAIADELDAWGGGDYALVLEGERFYDEDEECQATSNMILPISDEYDNDDCPRLIRAEWGPISGDTEWRITSNLPHASFMFMWRGDPVCEGVVIDLAETPHICRANGSNFEDNLKDG